MDTPKTLLEAINYFSDVENCRQFMISVRWADGVVRCPHCNASKVTWLAKAKVYRCYGNHPKQKFSLKVGTIFEDSAIGLEKWLPAAWLISNCKNGISSYELARALGVTQKSAWFMTQRLREAMKEPDTILTLGGQWTSPVEVDETYISGKPKNLHGSKRNATKEKNNKAIVMGMLDRKTREVRAKVIPNASREFLQGEILKHVGFNAHVFTDQHLSYQGLDKVKNFTHKTVNHMFEYVNGRVHTNGIENFWSLLKRTLHGTYVAVEPFHLDRYVDEQVFRFNNGKKMNDAQRFSKLMGRVTGRRLTLAELTGKVGGAEAF